MSTNFDEKIRPFCICSPKVGQNQQLSGDKIHTKVAQKVASCQKSKFWAPTAETSGSAMAEGPRDALVSINSATTKHPI